MRKVKVGTSSSRHCFSTAVGKASRPQVVEGDFLMILVTSRSVTGLKLVKEQVSCLCSGKSGKLVSSDSDCSESVIVLTLLTKNCWKRSGRERDDPLLSGSCFKDCGRDSLSTFRNNSRALQFDNWSRWYLILEDAIALLYCWRFFSNICRCISRQPPDRENVVRSSLRSSFLAWRSSS